MSNPTPLAKVPQVTQAPSGMSQGSHLTSHASILHKYTYILSFSEKQKLRALARSEILVECWIIVMNEIVMQYVWTLRRAIAMKSRDLAI